MKNYKLGEMLGGWFVGKFDPAVIHTDAVEVGIKRFAKGESYPPHFHKVADEITVIVSGRVRINQTEYAADDIIVQEKEECTDFEVLEDTVVVAVKMPSVPGDKYIP